MPRSTLTLGAAVALLLIGLAVGLAALRGGAAPRAGEATHRLMVESLLAEGDLIFDHRDLARGYRAWPGGPAGLSLASHDDGRRLLYGRPPAYALLATPLVALGGVAGFYLLNLVLYAAMAALALALLPGRPAVVRLWVGGFFLAAASAGWVGRIGPEVLRGTALLAALALWRGGPQLLAGRGRWLLAPAVGGLLMLAAVHQPLDLLLALPLVASWAWRRQRRALAGFVAGALLVGLLLVGAQRGFSGAWWPTAEAAPVREFYAELPIERGAEIWQAGAEQGVVAPRPAGRPWTRLPHDLIAGLAGRHGGLVPFYPLAVVALLLAALPAGRRRGGGALLAAWGLWAVAVWQLAPPTPLDGLGSPFLAAAYPLLVLAPGRLRWRWPLLPAGVAAALWTVPALLVALAGGAGLDPAARLAAMPTFAALPLEIDRLAAWPPPPVGAPPVAAGLPGYRARSRGDLTWLLPESMAYSVEDHPDGVWLRGATAADIVLIAPRPIDRLALTVRSLAPDNRVVIDGGGERWAVDFASPRRRQGSRVELPLVARGEALAGPFGAATWYRLRVRVSGGVVPARHDRSSADRRYLGVFLDFGSAER